MILFVMLMFRMVFIIFGMECFVFECIDIRRGLVGLLNSRLVIFSSL